MALIMNSAEARPNSFTESPETPAPSCSKVQVDEDMQTDTCMAEGPSFSVDQLYRDFQLKIIKVEEEEDFLSGGTSGSVGHITQIDLQNGEFQKKEEPKADEDLYTNDTLKVFTCSSCSLSYTSQIELHKHISICHLDKDGKPLITGENENQNLTLARSSSGTHHHKTFDEEMAGKTHDCSHCGKSFPRQSKLRLHLRIHTGEKPHHCSLCGKSFNVRGNLKNHQRIHTGEKPYQCSQCGKSFTQKIHLEQHQRIHTGEKPYQCPQCGRSFTERGSLRKHERIHTGEKPYHCSDCGRSFRHCHSVQIHQRTHTGEKPYHCSQCGKSFSKSKSFKKHQQSHTGEKMYHCRQYGESFTHSSASEVVVSETVDPKKLIS